MNDNRTIRIMVFEPGRAPYTTMLEDSLEHRQELVGGDMVLRGVTSEGKILVADPASKKRSEQEWDISIILDEARKGAAAGGPLWAIY